MAAVKQINKLRVDYDPTFGNQIIEKEVSKLHNQLKRVVSLSPHKKQAQQSFKVKPGQVILDALNIRKQESIDATPRSQRKSEMTIVTSDDDEDDYLDQAAEENLSVLSPDSPLRGTKLRLKLDELKEMNMNSTGRSMISMR